MLRSLFKKLAAREKDPVRSLITFSVLSVHIIFFIFLSHKIDIATPKKPKKLVVKTFQAPQKAVSTTSKKIAPIQPTKKKEAIAQARKSIAPLQKDKNTAPVKPLSKEPAKKKVEPQLVKPTASPAAKKASIPKDLLAELEQKISKLDEKKTPLTPQKELSIPQKIDIPNFDNTEDVVNKDEEIDSFGTYCEYLVSYLKQNLNLPDYGEVKVQITLNKNGTVEKFEVLSAASEKNKSYLQQKLSLLKFPQFLGKEKRLEQQTFVLTFCNEL